MTVINAATMPTHRYIELLAAQAMQTQQSQHRRAHEMEQVVKNKQQFTEAMQSINNNRAKLDYEQIAANQRSLDALAEEQRIQRAREAGSQLGTHINTFA